MGLKIKSPSTSYLGSSTKPNISNVSGLTVHSLSTVYLGSAVDPESGGGTPFLQSDGNAYITPLSVSQITKWEIDCAIDSSFFDDVNAVFGGLSSNIKGVFNYNNTFGGWNGSTSYLPTALKTQYPKTTNRQILITETTINISNQSYFYPLFAYYNNSNNITYPSKLKIYSAKFYNGNTLVRDLVPKEENGVAGMYDNISGDFFTNRGSGSFTYGEE